MINIFGVTAGMTGTKMLTEKPHRDGSPPKRHHRSDTTVRKAVDHAGVHIEDKQVTHELRNHSRKSSSRTPMKKLIEQEMSNETEIQKNPPSIVAKLMGLDTFPAQKQTQAKERSVNEGKNKTHGSSVHSVISGAITRDSNQQEKKNVYSRRNTTNTSGAAKSSRSQSASEHREYKDVYEVPIRTCRTKDDQSLMMTERIGPADKRMYPGHERFGVNDNRMDLVREQFTEAKRLATNRKLLHSKEFQDAIEILSSNRDLFLKFLEEPNSLFTEYIHELQRGGGGGEEHQPSQTRQITVLKPSNPPPETAADEKLKSFIPIHGADEVERESCSKPRLKSSAHILTKDNNKPLLSQPTRIVVLKPTPAKSLNGKMPASSPPLSPVHAEDESFRELHAHSNRRCPRNTDKEVTDHFQDSNCQYRRDETLLSSVLSNGYTGDESSFNRSSCEYMEDDDGFGNSSDSDIPSPITRHSWDCNHKFDSPYSLSSFSRPSYSPESSVIREAKKRLSERWVMVASNELGREQRSVSTLGEMLAIRGANKEDVILDGVSLRTGSYGREEELNMASSSLACVSAAVKIDARNDEVGNLPTLQRSKSVPASSSAYDNVGSDPCADKSLSKDKAKIGKSLSSSSFKLRVSNFFSRNKKSSLEKQSPGSQSCNGDSSGRSSPRLSSCNLNEGSAHLTPLGSPSLTPSRSLGQDLQLFGTSSVEAPLVLKASEKANETSAEPSPDSVLEAAFKDDANRGSRLIYQGADNIGGSSRAISRSPPIESIARSLPGDVGSRSERTAAAVSINAARHSLTDFLKADTEEQERASFVYKLLSAAGMSDETTSSVLTRWHSLDSPLNPCLLDQFLERKGEEARCRVRRSNQRLLFDSVNAALLDISWKGGAGAVIKGDVRSRNTCWHRVGAPPCAAASVTTQVLGCLNEWFSDDSGEEGGWTCMGYEQETSQVVDRIVRSEVGGSGWLEMGALEVLEVCKEMGEQVMQGLVAETLIDFIPFSGQLQ